MSADAATRIDPKTSRIDTLNFDRRGEDWFIDKAVQILVFIVGVSTIACIVGIFIFIAKEGFGFIVNALSIGEFFTSPWWRSGFEWKTTYDILAPIAWTAGVAGLAMLVAIPLALGAAIFIGEFATGKTREFLKVLVELPAAIPSVIWGFIALSIMNPTIVNTFDVPVGFNALNAGIILGLMAAPIMTSIAEDALNAVPDRYREAAEALGATRWQVTFKVVLPAARNGLLGAVLLGVGRGFGETIAVLIATGSSIDIPTGVFDSAHDLTTALTAELGKTAVNSDLYQTLFTIAIFLFLIAFMINLTADLIVRGIRES